MIPIHTSRRRTTRALAAIIAAVLVIGLIATFDRTNILLFGSNSGEVIAEDVKYWPAFEIEYRSERFDAAGKVVLAVSRHLTYGASGTWHKTTIASTDQREVGTTEIYDGIHMTRTTPYLSQPEVFGPETGPVIPEIWLVPRNFADDPSATRESPADGSREVWVRSGQHEGRSVEEEYTLDADTKLPVRVVTKVDGLITTQVTITSLQYGKQ